MGEAQGARQAWSGAWQHVPLHLLLPWAPQMLSLLDAEEGNSLLPTLEVTMPMLHNPLGQKVASSSSFNCIIAYCH